MGHWVMSLVDPVRVLQFGSLNLLITDKQSADDDGNVLTHSNHFCAYVRL